MGRELAPATPVTAPLQDGNPDTVFVRFAATLACFSPLLAAAQAPLPVLANEEHPVSFEGLIAPGTSSAPGSSSQVVPLWASDDGRLLAIASLAPHSGAPALPPAPAFGGLSDLRIIDATALFSTGLRWNPGHGLRTDLLIGVTPVLSSPLARLLDCSAAECLWSSSQPSTQALGASLGAGWTSSGASPVDFSFGLSWLETGEPSAVMAATDPLAARMALLTLDGGMPWRLDSSLMLSARGSWRLAQGPRLDLTAGVGRADAVPLWYGVPGGGIELNQMSLGLGVAAGSIRGSIVGHVISADDPAIAGARRWSGIDLGVSWRTPWRAELSVGAQNLWSLPLDHGNAREADSNQARMPYVQYRQDL